MAKKIYGPVNGARKEVTAIYGPVNGARKEVLKVYGSVNGARKLVWEKQSSANPYGILTYYGVTYLPAGTVTPIYGTPPLAGSLLVSLSDFTSAIQTQWINEGHYEQIDWSYPVIIDVYNSGEYMAADTTISQYANISVAVMTMDGYYTGLWNWYYYQHISSYIDIRSTEQGIYDGSSELGVSTTPTPIADKTIQSSFALTSLSMYNTGYTANAGFDIGTEVIAPFRIKSFEFGDYVTSVPNNFLQGSALETIDFGNSNITTIGNYFLSECSNFAYTGTLDLSAVTSIGTYFLSNCSLFNAPIALNENLTSIPEYFLYRCSTFNQPLTLPSATINIGANFMNSCTSFDQPLVIPAGVGSIPNVFLYYCSNFNSPITLAQGS